MKFDYLDVNLLVRNPNGCQANQYYTSIEAIPAIPGAQLSTGKMFI